MHACRLRYTYTCIQTVSLKPAAHFVSYTLTLTLVIAVLAFWPQWNVCDVVNIHKCVCNGERMQTALRG